MMEIITSRKNPLLQKIRQLSSEDGACGRRRESTWATA